MKIAKETWIIMAIGLADLTTTILLIKHQGAEEANPLFRKYWEMGLAVFICAKVALLIGPLSVLEWARSRRPQFVHWAQRSAIVAYLVMYVIGIVHLNNVPNPYEDGASDNAAIITTRILRLPPQLSRHFHRTSQPVRETTAQATQKGEQTITVY